MKKKGGLALILFCAAVLATALVVFWVGAPNKRSSKGFDAAGFVRDQEALLAQLTGGCREPMSQSLERCVDWSLVTWAWNSSAPAGYKNILSESCDSGSALSCERLWRIEEAQRAQAWHTLEIAGQRPTDPWPRIAELKTSTPIASWLEIALQGAVASPEDGADMACGLVVELPETLVCVSRGNTRINNALGRVVTYIEHGRKILSKEEHLSNPLLRFWQGSNLRRSDFESAVELLSKAGKPLTDEARLWNWMLARPWKYFLSFSAPSVFTGVPSHEFLHGLYFQSANFRNVVEDTLSSTPEGLERLKFFIAKIFDTNDKYILNNEIQAYLLQHQSSFTDVKSRVVRDRLVSGFRRQSAGFEIDRFMVGY
ncbi:MAG: hypothetical protein RI932_791 [Pseudomonadota bacterium]